MAKKEGPTARLKPRPFKTRSKPEFLHFRAEQQQLSARRNRRHRENALIFCWECWTCRGPFGFAQGRLFDYVAASLREAATPLRMTFQKQAFYRSDKWLRHPRGEHRRTVPGAEARIDSADLRGPEGPLFHGDPHIREFFRSL